MLKKVTLTGFSLGFLLIFAVFVACGSQKNGAKPMDEKDLQMPKEPNDVEFVFNDMIPHCGGMKPGPEVQYPIPEPIIGSSWMVYSVNEDGTRNRKVGKLTSDESGKATYRLKNGTYMLYIEAKEMPFTEFMKDNSPERSKYYSYGDEACFKKWYESPDLTFEVKSDTTILMNYRNNCFTNRHPCLNYDGPYPP